MIMMRRSPARVVEVAECHKKYYPSISLYTADLLA
jgi:hypothetical protein